MTFTICDDQLLCILYSDNNVKDEINTDNPLGTGGHMVLSFAVLMRLLWSGKFRSYAPLKLKVRGRNDMQDGIIISVDLNM